MATSRYARAFEAGGSGNTAGSTTSSPAAPSPKPPLGSPEAIAATVPASIRSAGKLVVGVNEPYAPAEFRDAGGNLVGLDVDLMNAIARTLGPEVEYRETAFESIIPSVQAKAFDVGLSSFTDTKDREAAVDFVTYFQAGTQCRAVRLAGPQGCPLAESLRQALMHLIATREYRGVMSNCGVEAGMINTP